MLHHLSGHRKTLSAVWIVAALCSTPSGAAENAYLPIRNHNPFLQIFGLPQFQTGSLTPAGRSVTQLSLDVANHSDAGGSGPETAVIDGESYYLNFGWRRGWSERLEVGLALPLVAHQRGFLDGPVKRWHDLSGLSNGNRQGRDNQLLFSYARSTGPGFRLDSPNLSVGDLRLTAAWSLRKSADDSGLAFRTSLKLPTGDEDKLAGSGAADLAMGIYATDNSLLSFSRLSGTAFAGVLLLGEGNVLPSRQKESVGFAGVSTAWQFSETFAVTGQLYGQSAYFDSDIDEIGGNSVQLAVGGSYRPRNSALVFSLGIIEDLFSDATTDVAFHFGIRAGLGQRR
ncbi:MAG: DUF3187 family protein [Gammaproteobacteria bacterium]